MREELFAMACVLECLGITPAHAGRIYITFISKFLHWDHPRACGKNLSSRLHTQLVTGSPPRMREEFLKNNFPDETARITPAHAGRIPFRHKTRHKKQDHPRACGKNGYAALYECVMAGSPPRMREESEAIRKGTTWIRITPAHAGRMHVSIS